MPTDKKRLKMGIYNFIDTIERARRDGYPAEALNFNGKYFEDEIKGYKTLNVTGREAIENEIDIIETKAWNGARYKSSRYKPRTITVRFQVSAKTPREIIEKFNQLNHLLDVEEARLIFHDEPDKFYIGTRQRLSPPKEGELFTRGEIEFFCADPYKYSVREYEVKARDGILSTMYRGTVPNPPVFRVKANADLAYVEFLKDQARVGAGMESALNGDMTGNAKVIPESLFPRYTAASHRPCLPEAVGMLYWENMEVDINEPETWGTYTQTETINGEEWLVPLTYLYNTIKYIGEDGNYSYYGLTPEELVGQNEQGAWNPRSLPEPNAPMSVLDEDAYFSSLYQLRGTGIEYQLEENGVTRPNFTLKWESKLYAEGLLQRGAQAYTIYGTETTIDENDTEVSTDVQMFGVAVKKAAIGTNRLEVDVYVDGEQVDTIIMSSRSANPVFGKSSLTCSVSRFGATYTLRLGNDTYTYAAGKTYVPTYVSIYVLDYTGAPRTTRNAIRYVKYTEHTAATAKGVRNLIQNGSELVVDCASADIRLNGISEPSLGDITNEWDAMELVPGTNDVAVSSVSEKAPEVIMTYREAYL